MGDLFDVERHAMQRRVSNNASPREERQWISRGEGLCVRHSARLGTRHSQQLLNACPARRVVVAESEDARHFETRRSLLPATPFHSRSSLPCRVTCTEELQSKLFVNTAAEPLASCSTSTLPLEPDCVGAFVPLSFRCPSPRAPLLQAKPCRIPCVPALLSRPHA